MNNDELLKKLKVNYEIEKATRIIEKIYEVCCQAFLQSLNDYTISYSDEIGHDDNRFHLHGADEGEYPPLNYCPNCGNKVVHFKPERDGWDGHMLNAEVKTSGF